MRCYNAMPDKIQPSQVVVLGTPFPEMDGNIITVNYSASRKVVR